MTCAAWGDVGKTRRGGHNQRSARSSSAWAPATNTSPSATTPGAASGPALPNAQGSGTARARIEADGYKNVQGLARNTDGSWSGKGMRGGSMVDVQVDARGNVMSR